MLDGFAFPSDSAPALLAPGRRTLTASGLADQIARTVERLSALGVSRADRVAIVLPNGPEMASTFLGVAATAVAAPLNPAYTSDELDYFRISSLSREVQQKLEAVKPRTLGQAGRIPGVTPAALAVLSVHLKRRVTSERLDVAADGS